MTGSGVPRMASVAPYAASWLLEQLAQRGTTRASVRAHGAWLRGLPQPYAARLAADLEGSWAQLEASALDHQERMRARQLGRASADGSAEVVETEMGAGSVMSGEMTTQEAADMLGIGARRVGQLLAAGELQGRKVGGAWRVDRDTVVAARDVRAVS